MGLGGRVRSGARSGGCLQQPGVRERSSRRSETHIHPGGVGRRPFVLELQRRHERGMCKYGGVTNVVVRRKLAPCFSLTCIPHWSVAHYFTLSFVSYSENQGVGFRDSINAEMYIIVSHPFHCSTFTHRPYYNRCEACSRIAWFSPMSARIININFEMVYPEKESSAGNRKHLPTHRLPEWR